MCSGFEKDGAHALGTRRRGIRYAVAGCANAGLEGTRTRRQSHHRRVWNGSTGWSERQLNSARLLHRTVGMKQNAVRTWSAALVAAVGLAACNSRDSPPQDTAEQPSIGAPDVSCPAANDARTEANQLPWTSLETPAQAGAVPGSFTVTPNGTAHYAIPLELPPGRNGVAPALSLVYDSGAGDGPFGEGFTLEGLSSVRRCGSNIAQDGDVRGVKYDSEDHLCLDGRRLTEVSRSGGQIEYRTFPETFQKVLASVDANGQPQTFEVRRRNGRILRYGTRDDARTIVGTAGAIGSWDIAREEDRRGNYIDYWYDHELGTNGHTRSQRVDRIEYTGHTGQGLAPSTRVTFVPQARVPCTRGYVDGDEQSTCEIVDAIRIEHIDDVKGGWEVVRWYELGYDSDATTAKPLLTSLTKCASSLTSSCLPPTRFAWLQDRVGDFADPITLATTVAPGGYQDPNRPDDLAADDGSVSVMGDVNGDGLDDLVTVSGDSMVISRNTGGAFAPGEAWGIDDAGSLLDLHVLQSWDWYPVTGGIHHLMTLLPLDYDMDGRTDFLVSSRTSNRWLVLHTSGNRFEVLDTGLAFQSTILDEQGTSHDLGPLFAQLADLTGDGILDFVWADTGGDWSRATTRTRWRIAIGGLRTFTTSYTFYTELDKFDFSAVTLTDVDGDGKVQLLTRGYDKQGLDACVSCGAGDRAAFGFERGAWQWKPIGDLGSLAATMAGSSDAVFADVNGDGLPEAVRWRFMYTHVDDDPYNPSPTDPGFDKVSGASLFITPNVGGRFDTSVAPMTWTNTSLFDGARYATGSYTGWYDDKQTHRVIDWNGDGKLDLLTPIGTGAGGQWYVLLADPDADLGVTFVATGIQWEYEDTLLVTDANADGRDDIVYRQNNTFRLLLNSGPTGRVVDITDGLNALDPTELGSVPNVHIEYENLVDQAILHGYSPPSLEDEEVRYRARWAYNPDCSYPVVCVTGSKPVVGEYAVNDGRNVARRFDVRYRAARSDLRLGSSLGFGTIITRDQSSGATTMTDYNIGDAGMDELLDTYPFAGLPERVWSWVVEPGKSEDRVHFEYTTTLYRLVRTHGGLVGDVEVPPATFFTFANTIDQLRAEGYHSSGDGQTAMQYVRAQAVAPTGDVLSVRHDVIGGATGAAIDEYGNATTESIEVEGAESITYTRTFQNDPASWLIGLVDDEKVCSTVNETNCRESDPTYNSFGEITSHIARGEASEPITQPGESTVPTTYVATGFDRDTFGNVIRTRTDDSAGDHRSSCVTFDPTGIAPIAARNALGHTSYHRVNTGLGAVIATKDPNGLVTSWRYDKLGRLVTESRPDGTETSIVRSRGRFGGPSGTWWATRTEKTTTGQAPVTTTYDQLGRVVSTQAPGPSVAAVDDGDPTTTSDDFTMTSPEFVQTIEYNSDRLVYRVSQRHLTSLPSTRVRYTWYAYDLLNRPTAVTSPSGETTSTAYDGTLATHTDEALHDSRTEYDGAGRLIHTWDKKGLETTYAYGPFNTLSSVTVGSGDAEKTSFLRDSWGRVRRETDPDHGVTTFAWNGYGEITNQIDADGRTTSFHYDDLGRLRSRAQDDLTTTTLSYDPAGCLGCLSSVWMDNEGTGVTKSYYYNTLTQHTATELELSNMTLRYDLSYDSAGRVSQIEYPQVTGFDSTNGYDPRLRAKFLYDVRNGQLSEVRNSRTDSAYWKLINIDARGRSHRVKYSNGVYTQWTRDAANDQTARIYSWQLIPTSPYTNKIQDLYYEYDDRLNPRRRHDVLANTDEWFTHDELDRLRCVAGSSAITPGSSCSTEVRYAANGNITYKSDIGNYYYNDLTHPHAVTDAGTQTYAYDGVGNQHLRPGWIIDYTEFDRPRRYTATDGDTISFQYDGTHARVRQTSPTMDIAYLDDLYERVREVSNATTKHRHYIPVPGATVLVVREVKDGGSKTESVLNIHNDALGSTTAITDSSGTRVEARAYDAFGAPKTSVSGTRTRLGFTGHESDLESGLINMRGRLYDPRLGRMLQPDPIIGEPFNSQDWNLYSYALNSPMRITDPTGLLESDQSTPTPTPTFTGTVSADATVSPMDEADPTPERHYHFQMDVTLYVNLKGRGDDAKPAAQSKPSEPTARTRNDAPPVADWADPDLARPPADRSYERAVAILDSVARNLNSPAKAAPPAHGTPPGNASAPAGGGSLGAANRFAAPPREPDALIQGKYVFAGMSGPLPALNPGYSLFGGDSHGEYFVGDMQLSGFRRGPVSAAVGIQQVYTLDGRSDPEPIALVDLAVGQISIGGYWNKSSFGPSIAGSFGPFTFGIGLELNPTWFSDWYDQRGSDCSDCYDQLGRLPR